MENSVKGKAIVDFEKIIAEVETAVADAAYDKGVKDGKQKERAYIEDDGIIEKHCTEYVVEKFSDCKTLEDFTVMFKEIETRSFNFMR